MSAARWILNFWPGLPQLWWRGTWRSMSIAVAFAVLLNSALFTSFVEGIAWSPWLVVGLWVAVILASLGACLTRVFDQSEVVSRDTLRQRELTFQQAQTQYLKGHWFEAEKHVRELLASEASDAEARLLLATILRRSGRVAEASKQLIRLAKCPSAFPWQLELEQELAKVAEAEQTQPDSASEPDIVTPQSEPTTLAFPGKAA